MNCKLCRIGHPQLIQASYVQWHNEQIMIIPHAPAFSCDICGHMEYDDAFIYKLDYLLDRLAENTPERPVMQSHSALIEPAQWSPT